ncbi:MAG TPA: GH92 family glycosyl hydrolase [Holophagaceae bacterium]|nr:GH92 family glycosyl hydrolase [Holophagaceae bacterium]
MLRRLLLPLLSLCLAAAPGKGGKDWAGLVDPFIGTGNLGHTFPGATLPFGMVQPSPDTRLRGWGSCAGYVHSDTVIYGFSQTHLSGTGIPDYGDILLLPATGAVKLRNGYLGTGEDAPGFDPAGYGSRFDKATEQASPGAYAVTLDDYGVRAELTATTRVAFHRYTFAKAEDAHILIDLTHHDQVLASSLKVLDDHTVAGMRRSKAWAQDQPVYFVATFSRPFRAELAMDDTIRPGMKEASGLSVKAVLHFDLKPGEQVLAKVAISAVDEDGATKNLAVELPGWDFEATRAAARAAWNRELGKIEVEGGTPDQRTIFYTGLYHALIQPNTFQDVDGRYLGRDLKIHTAQGWTEHTVFSLWDTHRAAHPLYTLIEPGKDLDFVKTFLAEYRDGGRLPVWELWANETNCMIGYHAVPVIVDAWMKGLRGFDPELALEAMKHSAEEDFRGLKSYRAQGFINADAEPESVSKTLEYAYDDWCIAQFAKAIGHMDDYRVYTRRAESWQHLMDPQGFFHPRQNGMWKEPFDLQAITFDFTEATPWQYAFAVPQDVDGFMKRLGGPDALEKRLDGLFAASSEMHGWEEEDVTGLVGQYAHGNEPSHHIAYLYDYAGRPWKTQALVRRLMDGMYSTKPDGMAGNEDCGQMSAWYVLSALGIYEVCPGRPEYAIGSPLFDKAVIHLVNGKRFTIRARHNGGDRPYIQSARLDGKSYARSFITHAALLRGGELDFEMGRLPSHWGSSEADRPHSEEAYTSTIPAPVAEGESVFQGTAAVKLAASDPADRIHYTFDGGDPTEASPVYDGPFILDRSATLRFRARRGQAWSPVVESRFVRLPDWPKLRLDSGISPTFRASGPLALIDDARGTTDFRAGNWQGFFGQDLRATLDLGEIRDLHHLSIAFLQDPYTWTYFPLEVRFEISDDGQSWTVAGAPSTPPELMKYGPHLHDGKTQVHGYDLDAAVRGRFVRVTARSPITIPKGSWREGKTCFICADEIVVR